MISDVYCIQTEPVLVTAELYVLPVLKICYREVTMFSFGNFRDSVHMHRRYNILSPKFSFSVED